MRGVPFLVTYMNIKEQKLSGRAARDGHIIYTHTRMLYISTFTYIDSKWIVAIFNLQSDRVPSVQGTRRRKNAAVPRPHPIFFHSDEER